MKTIREVLSLSTQYLKDRQIDSARREAEDLLSDALCITRISLYMDHDRPLSEDELIKCRERLQRRGKGEPLAYIHGEVLFYDCQLKITPAVLIPRPETELLVDKVVNVLKDQDLSGKVLWDICCGSGCIGIALKKKLPALTVHLSDISPHALNLAKENALQNDVEVTMHEGDLLSSFAGKHCDYVVCNPPYISESDYAGLSSEVRNHEPRQALVAENNGYAFYERLAQQLPQHLNANGQVWFEIGTGMGPQLLTIFSAWQNPTVEKDWSQHDRFFTALIS